MSLPPAGPPPGYQGPQGPPPPGGVPQGYGEPTVAFSRPGRPAASGASQPGTEAGRKPAGSGAVLVLGIVAVAAVVLGLTINENGHNAWDSVNAWGVLAIAAAAATLAPGLGRGIGLGPQRAWQVAVCGAGALVLFWVLLVLPGVGSNTSLLTTIGVAAGVIAAWLAPGRAPASADRDGPQASVW